VRLVRYLLLSWFLNAVVLGVVIALFPKVTIGSFGDLLEAALVFGLLNTIVKPVLKLLTLPLAVVTLGLIWFGIAMLMLKVTDWIVGSFEINGFLTLVWAAIVVWVLNVVLDFVPGPWRESDR